MSWVQRLPEAGLICDNITALVDMEWPDHAEEEIAGEQAAQVRELAEREVLLEWSPREIETAKRNAEMKVPFTRHY